MTINGKTVRALREQRSWSQEHFAHASGLSVRTVQRVESGNIGSAETRLAIAAALDVPVDQLLSRPTPDEKRNGPRWKLIIVALVAPLLMLAVILLLSFGEQDRTVDYETFHDLVRNDQINQVKIQGQTVYAQRHNGDTVQLRWPDSDKARLFRMLRENRVGLVLAVAPDDTSMLQELFWAMIPIVVLLASVAFGVLLLILVAIYIAFRTGKTRAKA